MKNVTVSVDEETHRLARIRNPKAFIYLPLLLTLAFIISCQGTPAEPVVVEKEAPKEEEVVVKEVAKVVVVEHDRPVSIPVGPRPARRIHLRGPLCPRLAATPYRR